MDMSRMLSLQNLILIAALTLARTALGDESATADQPPTTRELQLQLGALQRELAAQRQESGTTRQALSEQRQRLDAQARELEAQKVTLDSSLPDVPQAHESVVRFYGFADMGLQKLSMDNDNLLRTIAPRRPRPS
jgi:septal ring factor EnvC (AmiA/AmiB activator)